jgi:DNA repair protein RadD
MKKSLITPFPYQESAIQDCINYLRDSSNNKPQVVVAPTASGKSILISETARRWNKPCLVLQPNKELLEQNLEKLEQLGGSASVYSASLGKKEFGYMIYATLGSIKGQATTLRAMGIETVFIDEAHYGYPPEASGMFMTFINELKPKKVIGFTATPFRLSSSMGGAMLKMLTRMRPSFFKEYLHIIQIQEIIKQGRWSDLLYETYSFDEEGLELNTSGSDFKKESIRQTIKGQGINNSIYIRVKNMILKGERKNCLVFIDSSENAEIMSNALNAKGIPTAYVLDTTSKKERTRIVKEFKSGKIKVLINYGIFTTGFDYPELEALIMGRPTNSLASYYQIIGRLTRVSPKKLNGLYIDFCNNVKRFGRAEDLVIEEVEKWGWAMTSGDRILTNCFMANKPISKKDVILGKVNKNGVRLDGFKMTFGKYKGEFLENIPMPTIKWYLDNLDFSKIYSGATLRSKMIDLINSKNFSL